MSPAASPRRGRVQQLCYLANGYDGLRIYDVSDPTNPTNVGHINNGGYAEIVAVSGNYALSGQPR